jgi:filamentous hemagglutinin family protein
MLFCWSGWTVGLAIASTVSVALPAQAQLNLTPDTALDRALDTRVESFSPQTDVIRGGARPQNGTNLFHSFQEFNVRQGRSVYFDSPTGVQNIFSRVTGGNPSQILGRLGTLGGTANLFLLNPSGILFGPGARLDVQGSFVATTANRIQFGERGFFSATQPEIPTSLLTVNPSALWFTQSRPEALISQSNQLVLRANRSLVLLGGELRLAATQMGAIDGRVELGAAGGTGQVGLTVASNGIRLQFPADLPRADIALTENSAVLANQLGTTSIAVNARNFTMAGGSRLFSGILTAGSADRRGGDIAIDATETVTVTGESGIGNLVLAAVNGAAGDIRIRANQFILSKGAVLQSAADNGNSGNVQIRTTDSVRIDGLSRIGVSALGRGNAGNIEIEAGGAVRLSGDPERSGGFLQAAVAQGAVGQSGTISIQARSLSLNNNFTLLTTTLGEGDAGNIQIRVQESLRLSGGSDINASTSGRGNGGDIAIEAGGQVQVDGFSVLAPPVARRLNESSIRSEVTRGSTEDARGGTIAIRAQGLAVTDQAIISTAVGGQGTAGDIDIRVEDGINLTGGGFIQSSIAENAQGRSGDILLQGRSLRIDAGSQVLSSVFGVGNGGDIKIRIHNTTRVSGSGTQLLRVNPDGTQQVETAFSAIASTVETGGRGNSGNINLKTGVLNLDRDAGISTNATSGQGGNLRLHARDYVLLRRSGAIAASAGTAGLPGDGGNVTLQTPFLIAAPQENSDISANSFSGRGGQVTINAEEIFWFTPRSREDLIRLLGTTNPTRLLVNRLPTNDISAVSRQNSALSGVVILNTPDLDPSRGLIELPANLVDPSDQVTQRCSPSRQAIAPSTFYITGTDTLPYRPGDLPLSTYATGAPRPTSSRGAQTPPADQAGATTLPFPAQATDSAPNPAAIVEAQGWRRDAAGAVWLVAQAGTLPALPVLNPLQCDR